MRELATSAREQWIKEIESKYPRDVPTPNRTPNRSAEFLTYIATTYADIVSSALDFPVLLDPGHQLKPTDGFHRLRTGVHRQSDSIHSGSERVTNIHPQILPTHPADATKAVELALAQRRHFPKEQNAARRLADTHGMLVRVEWGKSAKRPYEVDTEPAGVGMLMMLSPEARRILLEHRGELGSALWAYMKDDRVDDSQEHLAAPLATPDMLHPEPNENSGLLLPFMRTGDDLPEAWHGQSIFPVRHMEDKRHLVSMGLAYTTENIKDWEKLIQAVVAEDQPTVIRKLVGSCATGMVVYGGSGNKQVLPQLKGSGFDTKARALKFIRDAESSPLLWRPFAEPARLNDYRITLTEAEREFFGLTNGNDEDQIMAIRRYYVLIHTDGSAECLGGFTTARRDVRVHGANDALIFVQAPPEKRGV